MGTNVDPKAIEALERGKARLYNPSMLIQELAWTEAATRRYRYDVSRRSECFTTTVLRHCVAQNLTHCI